MCTDWNRAFCELINQMVVFLVDINNLSSLVSCYEVIKVIESAF